MKRQHCITTRSALLLLAAVLYDAPQNAALGLSAKDPRAMTTAIYDADDRREIDDSQNQPKMVLAASSVAIIVSKSQILKTDQFDLRRIQGRTYGERYGLCEDEPFYSQPAPGFCTGFLVGSNLLLTAGHCIRSSVDCANTAFVFNFSASRRNPRPELVDVDDVFYCRNIEEHSMNRKSGVDYTLLRLNRVASNRRPLAINTSGEIEPGTHVTGIGHPHGIPLKISANATVLSQVDDSYFTTDLDALSASSGSPVLNNFSGLVEGMIVRGDVDFASDTTGCQRLNRCQDDCRGEEVLRINKVKGLVRGSR